MATDTTEQFEDIDWDELGGFGLPLRTRAFAVTMVAFAALVAYEVLVMPDRANLVPGIQWNPSAVDWLFVLTLLVGLFFVVVPLYSNRRMTMYYWQQFKKNRAAVASAIYLVAILVIGTIGPYFLGQPQLDITGAYQPPLFTSVSTDVPLQCDGAVSGGRCFGSWQHPLGTTAQGKDIVTLVVSGMRVSMQVGLITMLIIITIASAVGTTAAYFGGMVDEVLMRYVDIQITFPTFFLFLILVFLFGGSLFLLILIFGLFGWGGIARLVRSEALQRAEEEYIQAAENAGASDAWIIRRHLLPNVSNTVITAATLLIPGLILAEAAFSFLELTNPTTPSWGRVIARGRGDLQRAWWISTIPGVFLFLTVLAFNFMGDALRDALDPRSEGET